MAKWTVETIIDAPIDAVFQAYVDVERYPEWTLDLLNSTGFEVVEATHGAGTRWRKRIQPHEEATGWEEGRILEAERPSRIVTETTSTLQIRGKEIVSSSLSIRTLEPLEDGRTRVRVEGSQEDAFGPVVRVIMWFARPGVNKKLKKVVETEARALSEYLHR